MKKIIETKAAFYFLFALIAIIFAARNAFADDPIASAHEEARARWGASLLVWQSLTIGGTTRVDERTIRGNDLSLGEDLGLKSITSVGVDAYYQLKGGTSFHAAFDNMWFYGGRTLSSTVNFNGTTLLAGSQTDARATTFYRFRLYTQLKPWNIGDSTRLAPQFGLVYDLLHYHIDSAIDPSSAGVEPSENFSSQSMPLPFIGGRFEQDLGRNFTAFGNAWGTYLPAVTTWYVEGGNVKETEGVFDASVGAVWSKTHLSVSLAYLFRYYQMIETSHEDHNYIRLFATGPQAIVSYKF